MAQEPKGTEEFTLGQRPWWDLAEVADHDARIFGPTAWSVNAYWAVAAQPGTRLIAARATASPTETAGAETSRAEDSREEAGGGIAGWIVMSAAGDDADVMTIASTEAARGRGLGRALLTAGIDWAWEQGARTVHLEVDEHNAAAIRLYSALGFIEWGRRPDYYPGADAILMRLRRG